MELRRLKLVPVNSRGVGPFEVRGNRFERRVRDVLRLVDRSRFRAVLIHDTDERVAHVRLPFEGAEKVLPAAEIGKVLSLLFGDPELDVRLSSLDLARLSAAYCHQ